MCGTGRVSIPLLEAGRKMVCVDYSKGMIDVFREKISDKNYNVELVEADVTKLDLYKKFKLIILPFHSISEIISAKKQKEALCQIAKHLDHDGTFILTLQNPVTRLLQADGKQRKIGEFPYCNNTTIIISSQLQHNETTGIVSGFQFYDIRNSEGKTIEHRQLEINFRPIQYNELQKMLVEAKLIVSEIYGDYNYAPFNEKRSGFIICKC